jgi:hypothetical protein
VDPPQFRRLAAKAVLKDGSMFLEPRFFTRAAFFPTAAEKAEWAELLAVPSIDACAEAAAVVAALDVAEFAVPAAVDWASAHALAVVLLAVAPTLTLLWTIDRASFAVMLSPE